MLACYIVSFIYVTTIIVFFLYFYLESCLKVRTTFSMKDSDFDLVALNGLITLRFYSFQLFQA